MIWPENMGFWPGEIWDIGIGPEQMDETSNIDEGNLTYTYADLSLLAMGQKLFVGIKASGMDFFGWIPAEWRLVLVVDSPGNVNPMVTILVVTDPFSPSFASEISEKISVFLMVCSERNMPRYPKFLMFLAPSLDASPQFLILRVLDHPSHARGSLREAAMAASWVAVSMPWPAGMLRFQRAARTGEKKHIFDVFWWSLLDWSHKNMRF